MPVKAAPVLAAAAHTLLGLGAHAAVAVTFTVNECSNARFRFRSFTVLPDDRDGATRGDVTPVIARAAGTVRSADPSFLTPPVLDRQR